ncbi:MAG: FAD:protein FMN transferase [Chromatiales bacterium]|nr:FAD:protein FMN transferase [Chromatiales bacterium]
MTPSLPAAALLAGLLAGCGPAATGAPASPGPYTYQFTAFAAPIRIDILGGDRERADQAAARIEAFLADAGRDWYAWGDGELGAANAVLARAGSTELSPTLAAIVGRALALGEASGGRFDPTVGELVSLWGFDREERLAVTTAPPPPEVVAAARAAGGALADVSLTGRQITARRPLRIDLGGIAKGSALLRISAELESAGIGSALVDLGGSSLLAVGQRGDRPWRIGLRHPREDTIFAGVNLEPGESMATSGDYERFFKAGGRRYGHVIDPRTGAPATGAVSTTVLSTDPELADAAATALLVGGDDAFEGLVEGLGLTHALLITADGRLVLTPAMAERLAASNGGRVPPLGWNPAEP